MTLNEVIDLIQEWIVTNGNEEITADVLRPILEAMVNQPNDLIGDLDDLTTTDKDNLVEAINEVRTLAITNAGLVIHSGSGTPTETPPVSVGVGDFYAQVIFPSTSVTSFWQYNGSVWVEQRPQRTRTVLKFVSLVGVTTAGKSQVEWMAEAINLNISNGAVYECEDGDIIDFFVNVSDITADRASVRRIYTRLCTGATSVTSVVANDLMPDGSEEIAVEGDLIIELGDIGSDDVWTAFNADPSQPFEMDNEMFVSAIQDGEPKLWQWIGGTGTFGSTATPAVEADFLDLTLQPVVPLGNLYDPYDDISGMLAGQASQSTQQIISVTDASADTNITFPVGETRLQAYYRYLGTTNGTMVDYELIAAPFAQIKPGQIPSKAITNARMADMPAKTIKGRKETTVGEPQDLTPAQVKEMLGIDQFTTQEITSGGNYNDLEVTADLLVFTNENAQAVLNGIWGRKEFHILNLSSQYEILINHDSSSVSGNGQPIMLPTNSGTAGIKGTARVLQTDSYGYFVADTWGSKYRPEFSELTEDKVMLVGADHRAKAEDIIELKFYRTNQTTSMDSAELEIAYPNSIQGTEVICTPINKKYEKIDNLGNWVEIDFATV